MYEIIGEMVKEVEDASLLAGRATLQKFTEPFAIQDIAQKLDLTTSDILLDIGCGLGALSLPLSFLVKEVHGIDHPDVIEKLYANSVVNNCFFYGGNWMHNSFDLPKITKAMIYNVIQHTKTLDDSIIFIEKALSYLSEGGRLLIGDIPNKDKKARFFSTEKGKRFENAWSEKRNELKSEVETKRDKIFQEKKGKYAYSELTDGFCVSILSHFRSLGHEVYLLPQLSYLPWGYTREDILIIKY